MRPARSDAVVLNTGLALAVTAADSGQDTESLHRDVRAGMARAAAALDDGSAAAEPSRASESAGSVVGVGPAF